MKNKKSKALNTASNVSAGILIISALLIAVIFLLNLSTISDLIRGDLITKTEHEREIRLEQERIANQHMATIRQLQAQISQLNISNAHMINQLNDEILLLLDIIEGLEDITGKITVVFMIDNITYDIQFLTPGIAPIIPQIPPIVATSDWVGWTIDGINLVNPATTVITERTTFNAVYWKMILDIFDDEIDNDWPSLSQSRYFVDAGRNPPEGPLGESFLISFSNFTINNIFTEGINGRSIRLYVRNRFFDGGNSTQTSLINSSEFTSFAPNRPNPNHHLAKVDGNNVLFITPVTTNFLRDLYMQIKVINIKGVIL